MASITYDGRSFMLDGRRIWLVSGSLQYTQVPSEQWADRIHAAKLAGLNAIETSVVWAEHEPRPGQFDFTGDRDLRRFVELAGKAGLYCVLTLGPYVDGSLDMGGLPAWLRELPDVAYRTQNPAFLEASSRYLTAVAEHVRDLQVTAPGAGGPILLVQKEFAWTCGHDALADGYLGELGRYLREAGLSVPGLNNNNLWQEREGEIDTWTGGTELLTVLRQLGSIHPDSPRVVLHLPTREPGSWGNDETPVGPALLQRRLAECLAGGGQFNLAPFHGGTFFGFTGGRLGEAPADFAATSHDLGAPLAEAGGPGESYPFVRRICTFASSFARVFANLDPSFRPVVVDPEVVPPAPTGRKKQSPSTSVVHVQGSQGGVAFVFGPPPEPGAAVGAGGSTRLLLPDGSAVPVQLGEQSVAWCLFGVQLGGRHKLDACTLNAFAAAGSTFVCFGPAGSTGHIVVDGSPMDIDVPRGKQPSVVKHEGLTLVVCNEDQIDTCTLWNGEVFVGVASVRADGEPVLPAGGKQAYRIDTSGEMKTVGGQARPAARTSRKSLGDWAVAGCEEYLTGESPRYAVIDGPRDLTSLGSPYGYGWYRVRARVASAKKHKVILPVGGDRAQLFVDGETQGVLGVAPGATEQLTVALKKGDHALVALADNMGRFSTGPMLGEPKGLCGHLYETAALKVGKMTIEQAGPTPVLELMSPLWEVRTDDLTFSGRPTWSFTHRRKSPVIVRLDKAPARAVLLLNEQPVAFVDASGPRYVELNDAMLTRGKNVVELAILRDGHEEEEGYHDKVCAEFAKAVAFLEGTNAVTGKGEWAFAKWEAPAPSAFAALAKSAKPGGLPAWYRSTFTYKSETPIFLDLAGMTKGQVYLNGRHVGRYFVQTADGESVPPSRHLLLPGPWLRSDDENELVLFDEHGGVPHKVSLVADGSAAPITAR